MGLRACWQAAPNDVIQALVWTTIESLAHFVVDYRLPRCV